MAVLLDIAFSELKQWSTAGDSTPNIANTILIKSAGFPAPWHRQTQLSSVLFLPGALWIRARPDVHNSHTHLTL